MTVRQRCSEVGCSTPLSLYNPGPKCYAHGYPEDNPKYPRNRGHSRGVKLCRALKSKGEALCRLDQGHDGEHEWI